MKHLYTLITFITLFITTLPARSSGKALNEDVACWQSEVNPITKKKYTTKNDWDTDINYWQKKEPDGVSLSNLITAYNVYKKEKSTALKIGNDKSAHCYIGCRIFQETDLPTTHYVGWQKEQQDLTDCKSATHYEELDYTATVFGGKVNAKNKTECELSCKSKWGKRSLKK